MPRVQQHILCRCCTCLGLAHPCVPSPALAGLQVSGHAVHFQFEASNFSLVLPSGQVENAAGRVQSAQGQDTGQWDLGSHGGEQGSCLAGLMLEGKITWWRCGGTKLR